MVNMRRFLLLALLSGLALPVGCNPSTGETRIGSNTIRDYFTVRAGTEGAVTERDMAPTPRPREAILSDDYFGLKLEHIYAGNMVSRETSNLAIVAEIGGIVPEGIRCDETAPSEIGFRPTHSQVDNVSVGSDCRFKTIVQINPVFRGGHVTFDSAFITPPFRAGFEPLRLQFIIAELHDVALARRIAQWAEARVQELQRARVLNFAAWQQELVSVGFSAVNHILNHAARPTHVLEFTTDFVPVESVEGAVPQSLLMGGDFVIVAMPATAGFQPAGAMQAAQQLLFRSGRLYWRDDQREYRESPYVVFKVVRYGRYPGRLPIELTSIVRSIQQGQSAEGAINDARSLMMEMQAARTLNETEGALLLQMLRWAADAYSMTSRLSTSRPEETPPMPELAELPATFRAGLAPLPDLEAASEIMRRLEQRIYEAYGQVPGLRQEECVVLGSLAQELAEAYMTRQRALASAFEGMQLRRLRLDRQDTRSAEEDRELRILRQTEAALSPRLRQLPDALAEPVCPGSRRAVSLDSRDDLAAAP